MNFISFLLINGSHCVMNADLFGYITSDENGEGGLIRTVNEDLIRAKSFEHVSSQLALIDGK